MRRPDPHFSLSKLYLYLNSIRRPTDQIEMALFVLRYVSSLVIFALGLRAPGIIGNTESSYQTLDDGENFRTRYYQGVSLFSSSAF